MNLDPPPISTIRCELKKFRDAQRDSVSLLVTIHGKLSDPAASYTLDNAIADIKQFETDLCKIFDGLVNTSNSTTAYYHALVQKHGEREHMIKELTASGNSNVVTNHIQLLQNNKTEIERTMLSTEEIQHHIWIGIASIHFIQSHHKDMVEWFKALCEGQKKKEKDCQPKAIEMEGDSTPIPGLAE